MSFNPERPKYHEAPLEASHPEMRENVQQPSLLTPEPSVAPHYDGTADNARRQKDRPMPREADIPQAPEGWRPSPKPRESAVPPSARPSNTPNQPRPEPYRDTSDIRRQKGPLTTASDRLDFATPEASKDVPRERPAERERSEDARPERREPQVARSELRQPRDRYHTGLVADNRHTTLVGGTVSDANIALKHTAAAIIGDMYTNQREPTVLLAVHGNPYRNNSLAVPSSPQWERVVARVQADAGDVMDTWQPERYAGVLAAAYNQFEATFGSREVLMAVVRSLHDVSGVVHLADVRQALSQLRQQRIGDEYPHEVNDIGSRERHAIDQSLGNTTKEQTAQNIVSVGQFMQAVSAGTLSGRQKDQLGRPYETFRAQPGTIVIADIPVTARDPVAAKAQVAVNAAMAREAIGTMTRHGRIGGYILTGAESVDPGVITDTVDQSNNKQTRLLITVGPKPTTEIVTAVAGGNFGCMPLAPGAQTVMEEGLGKTRRADVTNRTDTINAGVGSGYHANRGETYKQEHGRTNIETGTVGLSTDNTRTHGVSQATTLTIGPGPRVRASDLAEITDGEIATVWSNSPRANEVYRVTDRRKIDVLPRPDQHTAIDAGPELGRLRRETNDQLNGRTYVAEPSRSSHPHVDAAKDPLPPPHTNSMPTPPNPQRKLSATPMGERDRIASIWATTGGGSLRGITGLFNRRAFTEYCKRLYQQESHKGQTRDTWEQWALRRSIPPDGNPLSNLWFRRPLRASEVRGAVVLWTYGNTGRAYVPLRDFTDDMED